MTITALSIAGTDPSGGAGIQADLKTFSALGAYGASVITALVAQNTQGVSAIHTPPSSFLDAQLESVFSDIPFDAVKIGMLGDRITIETVAAGLRRWNPPVVVVDPVMISKSGHALLEADAVCALREQILPLADLITPNLPEAAALLECPVAETEKDVCRQGEALMEKGIKGVLMKGGHMIGAESTDWLMMSDGTRTRLPSARIETRSGHGTGCTLSAALAALRPQCPDWPSTATRAKLYLSHALAAADSLGIGHGVGPVHHFYAWWSEENKAYERPQEAPAT